METNNNEEKPKMSIRCKYCNKKLGSAIQGCDCIKRIRWCNPHIERKLLRLIKNAKERKN